MKLLSNVVIAPFLLLLLCQCPMSYAQEWTPESDIITLNTSPGTISAFGQYAFLSAQDNAGSRLLEVFTSEEGNWKHFQQLQPPSSFSQLHNFGTKTSIYDDTALVLLDNNGLVDEVSRQHDIDKAIGIYSLSKEGWVANGFLPIRPSLANPTTDSPPHVRDLVLTETYAAVSYTHTAFVDGSLVRTDIVAIYKRNGDDWDFIQQLPVPDTNLDPSNWIQFGFDLAMSETSLAISTIPYGLSTDASTFGSVYIYNLSQPSTQRARWVFARRVAQDSAFGNATFGHQVDLIGDRLLVTASNFNSSPEPEGIAAYLYYRDDDGNWLDDEVIRSGDNNVQNFIAALYPPFFEPTFFMTAGNLLNDSLVVWTRVFNTDVGIGLKKTNDGWVPRRLIQTSTGVHNLRHNSFSQVATTEQAMLFAGRTQTLDPFSVPPALIVFDLECSSKRSIPTNQWVLLSPPCLPASDQPTLAELFASDFPDESIYTSDWIVYRFDVERSMYSQVELDDPLLRGQGYWLLQQTGQDVELSLPTGTATSTLNTATTSEDCIDSAQGCLRAPVATLSQSGIVFQSLGNPFNGIVELDGFRVTIANTPCATGCDFTRAKDEGIALDVAYRYQSNQYDVLTVNDSIDPWDGFWLGMYPSEHQSPTLVLPLAP